MGFSVVQGEVRMIWAPVDATDTLYVGQIVKSTSDGVAPLTNASGVLDVTDSNIPFGVVVAVNDEAPTFNSTYKANSITAVATQALQLARDWLGAEGESYPKSESRALVQLAIIGPHTVLKGRIFNTTYGTAPSVQTLSAQGGDGMVTADTAGAADPATFTADESTIFMRSGANKGQYRIGINTVNTAPQVIHAYPYDNATGNTMIQIPIRHIGKAKVNFDSESTFIDTEALYTSAYYFINVLDMDLSESGSEYCIFTFSIDTFRTKHAVPTT